ncbi:hypothetical protein GCM10010967_13430 [Dyadobacter beijingensis]|uniref:Uncharacterized protein n=1 Tax=Dyadobacter beijingensis TaxID=365489 RepID=A0ABQ2HIM4_9BACT|nr:hypothetical protein GCM10010967_13430 [Dyadobacter beijingensis]
MGNALISTILKALLQPILPVKKILIKQNATSRVVSLNAGVDPRGFKLRQWIRNLTSLKGQKECWR